MLLKADGGPEGSGPVDAQVPPHWQGANSSLRNGNSQRDPDGLPRAWLAKMKSSIRSLGWRFKSDRMVMDYAQQCYIPAAGGKSRDPSRRLRVQSGQKFSVAPEMLRGA